MTTLQDARIMDASAPKASRLLSLDVLRGLIILAMLFVNDIADVPGTPGWLRHAATHTDGMTFVDLVFPAFLFMVGMALPFAIGRRLASGDPAGRVWRHITVRTVGLVIIGFFMVNGDEMVEGGRLSINVWLILMYLGVMLLWNTYDRWRKDHPRTVVLLRFIGGGMLVVSALLYQGEAGSGVLALRPHWWGILGLIGWAYLAACVVYVPARKSPEALLGGMALFYLLFMAEHAGLFTGATHPSATNYTTSFASHAAIVLAGAMLGSMVQPTSSCQTPMSRVRWTLLFAGGLYLASVFLHALRGLGEIVIVSKNLATPTWCLRTAAYSALLWLAIYLIVDVWGARWGSTYLAAAGSNALFAYILAPLVVALYDLVLSTLTSHTWADLAPSFGAGVLRAGAAAMALTWLAGFLKSHGINLKL